MADFSVVAKLMADSSAFTKGVGEAKSAIENTSEKYITSHESNW